MNFASDNWSGATPAVMAAIARHNDGFAPAYGNDPLTAEVKARFSELFEREVEVFFAATGTGANGIAMAATAEPGGMVLCSSEAHIHTDEWGATEFLTGGMKLVPAPTRHGKIEAEGLAASLHRLLDVGRAGRPVTLSLTNATECGTIYRPDEVRELAGLAPARDMFVHMDGARFGNAVAALNASPAEITWKAGVDLMSFGGTKNGCLAAEAVIVFEPGRFSHLQVIRQRIGHTVSKARFVAAQFEGYLGDGNWLRTARHANVMAHRLADGIASSGKGRLGWTSEANEIFPVLPNVTVERLRAAGATFYPWVSDEAPTAPDETLLRLVTSFATTEAEVDRFVALL